MLEVVRKVEVLPALGILLGEILFAYLTGYVSFLLPRMCYGLGILLTLLFLRYETALFLAVLVIPFYIFSLPAGINLRDQMIIVANYLLYHSMLFFLLRDQRQRRQELQSTVDILKAINEDSAVEEIAEQQAQAESNGSRPAPK